MAAFGPSFAVSCLTGNHAVQYVLSCMFVPRCSVLLRKGLVSFSAAS